jgi:hypothetical protein
VRTRPAVALCFARAKGFSVGGVSAGSAKAIRLTEPPDGPCILKHLSKKSIHMDLQQLDVILRKESSHLEQR